MPKIIKNYISPIAFIILISMLGYETRRADLLEKDLLAANAGIYELSSLNRQNAEVLNLVKRDFNSSLNACFADYKNLAARFDNYRAVIAERLSDGSYQLSELKTESRKLKTCVIGGKNAIVNRLNAFNN